MQHCWSKQNNEFDEIKFSMIGKNSCCQREFSNMEDDRRKFTEQFMSVVHHFGME